MTDQAKRAAAGAAMELVEEGMILGLGTGSTAGFFIDALGERVRAGFDVRVVPTSEDTARKARDRGISVIEPDETTSLAMAVDGADEVDPDGNLIKGGGGAMLREKIVARAADRFVVIADASKKVGYLGAFPLPIEVVPFGLGLTIAALRQVIGDLGADPSDLALRSGDAGFVRTDNGHLILDARLGRITGRIAAWEGALEAIPGVVISGLFPAAPGTVFFGAADGTVERRDL